MHNTATRDAPQQGKVEFGTLICQSAHIKSLQSFLAHRCTVQYCSLSHTFKRPREITGHIALLSLSACGSVFPNTEEPVPLLLLTHDYSETFSVTHWHYSGEDVVLVSLPLKHESDDEDEEGQWTRHIQILRLRERGLLSVF